MIVAVAQYIFAVKHLDMMSKSLGTRQIYPIYDKKQPDKPRCFIGNSVIVFEVMYEGKHKAMRVYMRNHTNLRAIYGDNYYPKELLVGSNSGEYSLADVVLCDWYDGVSLQSIIEEQCHRPAKMAMLSQQFEEFAISILNERWAHGDIKPQNIILSEKDFHIIDFDAMYRDGFTVDDCVETGTRQFQHPLRDKYHFGSYIDDYPIALISTVLAALALDATLGQELKNMDYLLIQPHLAVEGRDEMLHRIEILFAEYGDVRHYRIAKLLHSKQPILPQLKYLLEIQPLSEPCKGDIILEYYNGLWGYAVEGQFVIPPLYDIAFDFTEGLALVCISGFWHFIDTFGRVAIRCGRGSGIKPFSGGKTHIVREDGEFVIFSNGSIERIS